MFKEKVNTRMDRRMDACTDERTDAPQTTDHDISLLAYGQ